MTYSFISYTSDTITHAEFDQLETFLSESVQLNEPASVNMFWEPQGLLHNIHAKLRWRTDQGRIYLILKDNRPIGVSCVEYPEGSQQFAIGGIRTYLDTANRGAGAVGAVLEQQTVWAQERSCQFMIVTFNGYNRVAHRAVGLSAKYRCAAGWSPWWDDCYAVPEPLNIRHTMQWVVVKPIQLNTDMTEKCQVLVDWANKYQ